MAQAASAPTIDDTSDDTRRLRSNVLMNAYSLGEFLDHSAIGRRNFPATRAILLLVVAAITQVFTACTPGEPDQVTIRFGISPADAGVTARDLKLYVHDIELLDENHRPHPLVLTSNAPWQNDRIALIDLAGAGERNMIVTGTVAAPAARYSGIRFTVGVPFELNHGSPLTARAPLDRGDMFWAWQSGHKFLRVDFATDAREWSFHLGSTGCSSASALRPPQSACAQPNLIRVELAGEPLSSTVRLHVDRLAAAMRAADFATCTGEYARDPACTAPFALTALRTDSGACTDASCSEQQLWTLEQ
jgi:uncharacterized repeat protein (TIGR04052 family)